MKHIKKGIFLLIISVFSITNTYSTTVKEDDITLALQSIIVAAAATQGVTLLTPPYSFPDASINKDGSASKFFFTLEKSDIGALRKTFLSFPPPVAKPKGFFEMLFESITSIFNNYEFIKNYLQKQHLSEQEIILTGSLGAIRIATSTPFRYDGEGSFLVEGNRISNSFSIEFTFTIPLEGENRGSIIPLTLLVNKEDALKSAFSIFEID